MTIQLPAALLWGFVATIVLTTTMGLAQGFNVTRMSLPLLLGTLFSGRWDRARLYGLVLHVIVGWGMSLGYLAAMFALGAVTWWMGAIFGATQAVFVLAVLLPILPGLHPRMASEHEPGNHTPMLEPPGFLALNYGPSTPLVVLLAHILYGAALGGLYRMDMLAG